MYADKECERVIMEALLGAFPTHRFIGEETAVDGTDDVLTDTPTWIIDPLGIPFYHHRVVCGVFGVCGVCALCACGVLTSLLIMGRWNDQFCAQVSLHLRVHRARGEQEAPRRRRLRSSSR